MKIYQFKRGDIIKIQFPKNFTPKTFIGKELNNTECRVVSDPIDVPVGDSKVSCYRVTLFYNGVTALIPAILLAPIVDRKDMDVILSWADLCAAVPEIKHLVSD